MMLKSREDQVMPEISIETISRPIYYLAYFLSMNLKEEWDLIWLRPFRVCRSALQSLVLFP